MPLKNRIQRLEKQALPAEPVEIITVRRDVNGHETFVGKTILYPGRTSTQKAAVEKESG